jgi:hypothetical protein
MLVRNEAGLLSGSGSKPKEADIGVYGAPGVESSGMSSVLAIGRLSFEMQAAVRKIIGRKAAQFMGRGKSLNGKLFLCGTRKRILPGIAPRHEAGAGRRAIGLGLLGLLCARRIVVCTNAVHSEDS